MINLENNKTALINLNVTITALDDVQKMIRYCDATVSKAPISCNFEPKFTGLTATIQFDRSIMLYALIEQQNRIIDYLASLGIEATPAQVSNGPTRERSIASKDV